MRIGILILALLLAVVVALACRSRNAKPSASPGSEEPHAHAAMAGHHRPHAMPHRFDDAEAWARHFDDPQRDEWQKPDAVIASLALASGAIVADVGAGTGYFTVRLARAVPEGRVIATDVEPDMVRYIEERAAKAGLANVSALQNRPDDPTLPEQVDVVFLCDVVHHIEDRPAFFSAAASQLRDGGKVVIVDFRPDAPEGTPGPPNRHRLSVAALAAELEPAGLRLVRADLDTLPYQYIAVFAAK